MENAPIVRTNTLPDKPLSPIEVKIAEAYAFGESIGKISESLEIPEQQVRSTLRFSDVREYVATLVSEINNETIVESRRLLGRMIRDKVEDATADDRKLGDSTRKDIPDLIRILNDVEKSNTETDGGDNYIAIIQQMSK